VGNFLEDWKVKHISVLLTCIFDSWSLLGPAGSDLVRKHRSCCDICWSGKNEIRGDGPLL
jgi:hypothetical protein